MAPQAQPRPEHGRQEPEGRHPPGTKDGREADRRSGDAGRVQREVDERSEQGEEQGGDGVGEQRRRQLRGTPQPVDHQEGAGVQGRDYAQGAHPLGARDAARVAYRPRAGEVDEVEKREPARQGNAEQGPQQADRPRGPEADRDEERNGEEW